MDVTIKNADHLFGGEGKTIKATQGGGFNPSVDAPRYARLAADGVLDIAGIISHRLPLANINEGLELGRAGQASRILIDMSL
jgi:S-(hydroxymethyl)glutathione dehydrogenase/alcohol dehydrogenase